MWTVTHKRSCKTKILFCFVLQSFVFRRLCMTCISNTSLEVNASFWCEKDYWKIKTFDKFCLTKRWSTPFSYGWYFTLFKMICNIISIHHLTQGPHGKRNIFYTFSVILAMLSFHLFCFHWFSFFENNFSLCYIFLESKFWM